MHDDRDTAATVLGHDEQVAILERAIAEYAKQGWHEWAPRPTPYETSLRRKSGLFARQFMAIWVEDDGNVVANYVGEGGRLEVVPVVFFDGD